MGNIRYSASRKKGITAKHVSTGPRGKRRVRKLGALGSRNVIPGAVIGSGRRAARVPRVDPDMAAKLNPSERAALRKAGYIQREKRGTKELGPGSGPFHKHLKGGALYPTRGLTSRKPPTTAKQLTAARKRGAKKTASKRKRSYPKAGGFFG